jgi:CRP-like cAMP-binding protein
MKKYISILKGTKLFSGVGEEDIEAMLGCLQANHRSFKKGDYILREGERIDRIMILAKGKLLVQQDDFWGNRSMVGLAVSGDIFAESYSLTGETLEVSVLAATDCEILFFNASKAVSGCAQVCSFHEQLSRNLLGILARKNLLLTEKMRHMARKTTREKLLSYLSAQALQASGPEFDIPLDRQQLADFLGVERSAMSAALGKLRDEGVLEFRKNHFRLLRSEEE